MVQARLFTPFYSRCLALANRIVVSPMAQYCAENGFANNGHLIHYGKFAQGRLGLIIVESTAVTKTGRNTLGDLGLWSDDHIDPLARIASAISAEGVIPGIQLFHAGSKAAHQKPWEGGEPLSSIDEMHHLSWPAVAPSSQSSGIRASLPRPLTPEGMVEIAEAFARAALRAYIAGFRMVEIQAGHGFLLHEFLSPLTNHRSDSWGGDAERRIAFPLKVINLVRKVWPREFPLWLRISVTDEADGGCGIADSMDFARQARREGIDLIDCSSGGFEGFPASDERLNKGYGYLVPFASEIRKTNMVPTMAVGLITNARQAETILKAGHADLVALGREFLNNPNWAWHAYEQLIGQDYSCRPGDMGWWLKKRKPDLVSVQPSS